LKSTLVLEGRFRFLGNERTCHCRCLLLSKEITPGKRLLGVKVCKTSGSPAEFGAMALNKCWQQVGDLLSTQRSGGIWSVGATRLPSTGRRGLRGRSLRCRSRWGSTFGSGMGARRRRITTLRAEGELVFLNGISIALHRQFFEYSVPILRSDSGYMPHCFRADGKKPKALASGCKVLRCG